MTDRDEILDHEQVAAIVAVYPHLELYARSHEALREKANRLERALANLSMAALRYRCEENTLRGRIVDEAIDEASTVLSGERHSRPGE